MTKAAFPTRREALEAKWFSRRHETGDANREARERYQRERGAVARRRRAAERAA